MRFLARHVVAAQSRLRAPPAGLISGHQLEIVGLQRHDRLRRGPHNAPHSAPHSVPHSVPLNRTMRGLGPRFGKLSVS